MTSLPTPYYDDGQITIFNADCRDILPLLEPGSVDLVLTDPPYGTGGWRRLESGNGSNPTASLIVEGWDDGDTEWLRQSPDVPVMTFWPAARTSLLLNTAIETGRTKHRCLYMRKRDPKPQVGGRTRWSVEPIWVLSRDGFLTYGGDDVIETSAPRPGYREYAGHQYQKPLTVLHWLIEKTVAHTILDPFMGSGTTLRAAKDLGRRAIGIEVDLKYCQIAVERLAQQVLPLEIPA